MSMLARYASLAAPAGGIQYVGGNTQTLPISVNPGSISLTALTGGLSSSAAEGDLVIVYYGVGYAAGSPSPGVASSGYTQVALLTASDSVATQLYVGYKRMGATPDTTVGLNAPASSGNNVSGAVVVHVWRGVDSVLPFDTVATTATGLNSVLCNPPSITPVTTGAVIVSGGAGGHSVNTSIAYTYSSSDLSNFVTAGSAPGGAIRQATVGVGSKDWTSGAFDPAAFTFSGTDSTAYSWAAVTLALLPSQTTQAGPFLISQATTASTGTALSALVINKPTGTREGDLMVAAMFSSGKGVTWTGDTGWTEVVEQGAGGAPGVRMAYKVAGASEGASYTFTPSNNQQIGGAIATYRNGAWDAAGAIATGASPLVLGAVTASAPFSRMFAAVGRDAASITITGPATMETIAIDANASAPSFLIEQDAALSSAGSSGTRSFAVNSTTNVAGVLAAIKPAASYTKYAQYLTQTTGTRVADNVDLATPACAPGNLLLMVVANAANGTSSIPIAAPSGWTLLSGNSTGNTAYQPGMYIFYRVADGTEAATYQATITNKSQSFGVGTIVCLAGVDVNTLTAGTTNTGSATTATTANGVTATTNGIVLYFGAQANPTTTVTFTPPSGMTEATEVSLNDAVDVSLEIAYQEGLSAGSTGTKTATASGAGAQARFRAILVTVGGK